MQRCTSAPLKQAVGRPIDLADIEHLKRLKAS